MTHVTGEEVLAALDAVAEDFAFPMLDNGYYYPVEVRLHAYGDRDRWLLVLETVGYANRARSLENVVTVIGRVDDSPAQVIREDFHDLIDNHDDLVAVGGDTIREGAPPAVVRGTALPVPVKPGSYVWDFCRTLVPDHRDLLLLTADELKALVPDDLPHLLTLDEWHHPDLAAGELPSRTETFRQLAAVFAEQDPKQYRPTQSPNTHWSNWPGGGEL